MLHINNLSITFKNLEKDVMAVKELSFKVKKGSFWNSGRIWIRKNTNHVKYNGFT